MDLLVSCSDSGGVRVVRLKKSDTQLSARLKSQFCIESKQNYVQQMLVFSIENRRCLALARRADSIQLYEQNGGTHGVGTYYQLVKEWKNSNMNDQDEIVKLGFLSNQYLYSCSNDGKLVIRDLINDDANQSYKVYLVHSPVSDIELAIAPHNHNHIMVASAGKNNELKLYEINLCDKSDDKHQGAGPSTASVSASIGLVANTRIPRPARRSHTSLNLRPFILPASPSTYFDRQVSALSPIWTSNTDVSKYIYNPRPSESISTWIVAVCILDDHIVCGTQFGKLLVYDIFDDTYPIHHIQVSQFPIKYVSRFTSSEYAIYTDSVSKIGIINMATFEHVKFWDNLQLGPLASIKMVLPVTSSRRRKSKTGVESLNFDPIYIIASRIDKKTVMYKLYDDNTAEMLFEANLLGTYIPSILILNNNEYATLHNLFGNSDIVMADEGNEICDVVKRRKLSDAGILAKKQIVYHKDPPKEPEVGTKSI